MDSAEDRPRRAGYGVKLVRGPILSLPPHPEHTNDPSALAAICARLRQDDSARPLAADLFSGAGGMSLGLRQAGIECVLSVDHYPEAVETHAHHFGGLSVDWDLADADVVDRVSSLIIDNKIQVLVGGPPCQPFSKAGRSGIRFRVRNGQRDPHDQRRDLWRSFLEVVRLARPRVVVMENVPDMALDTEMFILRAMVEDLEQAGYSVEERVVDTWRYGVPQFRQRLLLVALADRVRFNWPAEVAEKVTVSNAIGDLPHVEGGWRPEGGARGWSDYEGPTTSFQQRMRAGVDKRERNRVFDHITRPVREDDVVAFNLMDSRTRYSELPAEVRRYRDDIFDDKYKRLDGDDLSRTITAHIAKDGYWYIHPDQPRTITVREAARLQTFPDHYRFAGGPSAAFKQIGNAVPPELARHIAEAVMTALREQEPSGLSSQEIAASLAAWFRAKPTLSVPWLRGATRWQVIAAASLLDRSTPEQIRQVWAMLRMWPDPVDTLKNTALLRTVGRMSRRADRIEGILNIAQLLSEETHVLDEDGIAGLPGVGRPLAQLAVLAAPTEATESSSLAVPSADFETAQSRLGVAAQEITSEEPVLSRAALLRVAARYTGEPVDVRNRLTDGRLAIARMIGGGVDAREAELGLIELAAAVCRPTSPLCSECPLRATCRQVNIEETLLEHVH